MNEDMIMGLLIFITWIVGILATMATTGFICWGIYRLVIHFL